MFNTNYTGTMLNFCEIEFQQVLKTNNTLELTMIILTDSEEEFIERVKPLIKKHQEMRKRVGSEPEEGSCLI